MTTLRGRRAKPPQRTFPPAPEGAPCLTEECIQAEASKLARVFPVKASDDWKQVEDESTPSILLAKVPKTGSSTAAGVALRIGKKYGNLLVQGVDHGIPSQIFATRSRDKTMLFGSIRSPESRAMSFLYYHLSRNEDYGHANATDYTIRYMMEKYDVAGEVIASEGRGGVQSAFLSLSDRAVGKRSIWSPSFPSTVKDPNLAHRQVEQILKDYDFILLNERMDESLVTMSMLFGFELGDILVTPAKRAGKDYLLVHERNNACVELLKPPSISEVPKLNKFFRSDGWKAMQYTDYVLHAAMNKSLDLTIASLDQTSYEQRLSQYRQWKTHIERHCQDQIILPCSPTGRYQAQEASSNCYHNDFGCGYRCIDELLLAREAGGSTT